VEVEQSNEAEVTNTVFICM